MLDKLVGHFLESKIVKYVPHPTPRTRTCVVCLLDSNL